MSDLTDDELDYIGRCLVVAETRDRMVAELRRRRAEQAAGREHVERVVREMAARIEVSTCELELREALDRVVSK